jgi:hypothetical protein
MTELNFKASDYVLAAAGMRVTARYSGAADDLRLADEWLAQARTKQLPSTRTEIGAGGELIDRENRGDPIVCRPWASVSALCFGPSHRLPCYWGLAAVGSDVCPAWGGRRVRGGGVLDAPKELRMSACRG